MTTTTVRPVPYRHVPTPRELLAAGRRSARRVAGVMVHPEWRWLWLVLVIAALLRLTSLDLIRVDVAGVQRLEAARALVQSGRLPLAGIAPAEPPLLVYLIAPAVALGAGPRGVAAALALLNLLAVWGLYAVARRYYGHLAALVAAILLALNPWGVLLARELAPAALLPPLGVLLLHGLLLGAHERQPAGWIEAWLAAGLAALATLSVWPWLLLVLLASLAWARGLGARYALLGAAGVLLLFLPWLYYRLGGPLAAGAAAPRWGWGALGAAARLHTGRGLELLAGAARAAWRPGRWPWSLLLEPLVLLFWLSLPGLAWLAWRAWSHWRSGARHERYWLLLGWLVLGLVTLALRAAPAADEPIGELSAVVLLWPAGLLGMALLLERAAAALARAPLDRRAREWLPLALWSLMAVVCLWLAAHSVYLQAFVSRFDTAGGYGPPFRLYRLTAAAALREAEESGNGELWIVAEGSDPASDAAPAVLDHLLRPHLATLYLGRGAAEGMLLPLGRPALYLLARRSAPVEATLADLGARDLATVSRPAGETFARLLLAPGLSVAEAVERVPNRWAWPLEAGPLLLGFAGPLDASPGRDALVTTWWTFDWHPTALTRVPGTSYNVALFLAGPELGPCDEPCPAAESTARATGAAPLALAERYWRQGLLLVQWQQLPLPEGLPAGDYALFAGLYSRQDLWPSPVLDERHRPLADWVPLTPLRLGAPVEPEIVNASTSEAASAPDSQR